jgi:uncharacterized protein (TIGR04442 family)
VLRDVTYHAILSDTIELFATVSGPNLTKRFYFEEVDDPRGQYLRFFAPGSQVHLSPEGVAYQGNGGVVSPYMFGAEMPVEDLLAPEVGNRLVFFGTIEDPETGELVFTSKTGGRESLDQIFLYGHAVTNSYFFIHDRLELSVVERQKRTLRLAGKLLKRTPHVGVGADAELVREMRDALGESDSTIFLIRVVHEPNRVFAAEVARQLLEGRSPGAASTARLVLDELAQALCIGEYQRERIKIDALVHQSENRALVDEYKRILGSVRGRALAPSERARLLRLRTLALRGDLPPTIFDTLERIVLGPATAQAQDEPDYLASTREMLEGFLIASKEISKALTKEEILDLLANKMKAAEARDAAFEELLLETGRLVDEFALANEDVERMEAFGELITYFDRYDASNSQLQRLAFFEEASVNEGVLRSLIGNRRIFESLEKGLFRNLFFEPVLANDYLLPYGRRKILTLADGLGEIEGGRATLGGVAGEIQAISEEETSFLATLGLARGLARRYLADIDSPEGRRNFVSVLTREAEVHTGRPPLAAALDAVLKRLQIERFYVNSLLPEILSSGDGRLRADFIANSGLDRFAVEEIEREYLAAAEIDPSWLARLEAEAKGEVAGRT